MTSKPKVLIIDPSEESSEALKAVLDHSGFHAEILPPRAARQSKFEGFFPQVIVVDENALATYSVWFRAMAARYQAATTKVIFIGSRTLTASNPSLDGAIFTKPYHYPPLIRTIERLVQEVESPAAARAA